MIIRNIDIESFGKFSGKAISAKPGFNLVFGNNEDGKSTLMAFIKLMFYGSLSKSADISKNPRRKYSPWNGAAMSGSLDFELDGETFRLHKEFKKSSASDLVSVFSQNYGEKLNLSPAEEVGKHFLDMDLGEFERSVFVESYGGFSSEASADSLAMRIANFSVSGDEHVSKAVVLARISAAKEELISKNGKKGLLIEAREEIEKLKHRLFVLSQQTEEQYELRCKLSDLKSQIHSLEQIFEFKAIETKIEKAKKDLRELTILSEALKQKSKLLLYLNQYGQSLSNLKERVDFLDKLLNRIPDISALYEPPISPEDYSQLLSLESELVALNNDKIILENQLRSAATALHKILKKQKRSRILCLTSSIVFLLFAVLGIIQTTSVGFDPWLCSWSALLAGGAIIAPLLHKLIHRSKHFTSASKEYESCLRLLSFFSEDLPSCDFKKIQLIFEERLTDCRLSLKRILSKFQCKDIAEFKTKAATSFTIAEAQKTAVDLKEQFVSQLSQLRIVASFEDALVVFAEIQDTLEALEKLEGKISFLSSVSGFASTDIENIDCHISQLKVLLENAPTLDCAEQDMDSLKQELSQKRNQLTELQGKLTPPLYDEDFLLSQLSEAESKERELSERYQSLSVVSQALEAATLEMNNGFGAILNKKTGLYLSKISGGKYSDVLVSRNLDIEVRSTVSEGYHHWKHLSSGAIDKLYLALRLAATDIIAQKSNPLPLFLDDILAQYDHQSCQSALMFLDEFLKTSGAVSQIFFFTCHKHIANMVKEIIPDSNEIIL